MVWISSGGKGVGGFAGDDINFRHGKAGAGRQFPYHCVKLRGLILSNLPGFVHPKHNPVTEPICSNVHYTGQAKGNHHTILPAQCLACYHQQCGQRCH